MYYREPVHELNPIKIEFRFKIKTVLQGTST